MVFADKSLIDMARLKPTTPSEMSAVHGVGEAKLRQYGEVFLDVIRQHAAEHAVTRPIEIAWRRDCRSCALLHRIPRVC